MLTYFAAESQLVDVLEWGQIDRPFLPDRPDELKLVGNGFGYLLQSLRLDQKTLVFPELSG